MGEETVSGANEPRDEVERAGREEVLLPMTVTVTVTVTMTSSLRESSQHFLLLWVVVVVVVGVGGFKPPPFACRGVCLW